MAYRAARTAAERGAAAAALKKLRPAYAQILDFYVEIFQLQEASKAHTCIEPVRIPEALLQTKAAEKLPLIGISDFRIDPQTCRELLQSLCEVIKNAPSSLADAARVVSRSLIRGSIDAQQLFTALLSDDASVLSDLAARLDVDQKALAAFVYAGMQPSLSLCAEQLAGYLPPPETWQQGYCPICGSAPGLSFLAQDGDRSLVCSFCWWSWPITRVRCPYCRNSDDRTLHYFFSEQEEEWRVDVCDECRKYIKTLDTRKVARPVYFPLEQITSLHLDLQARETGYESPGAPQLAI